MTVRCANGHASEAEDYCDICGEPIGATSPPPAPAPAAPPAPVAVACPTCGFTASPGALFCENCGYDFTTGTSPDPIEPPADPASAAPTPEMAAPAPGPPGHSPAAVTAEPAPVTEPGPAPVESGPTPDPEAVGPAAEELDPVDPAPAPSDPSTPAAPHPPAPQPAPPATRTVSWVVEVWIDPDWYAVQESTDPMPSAGPPTLVTLTDSTALVGRHSVSRGIKPQVDCGTDTGVSRRHCQLTTDGQRWWVEDLQSSNGTYVGAVDGPLPSDPIGPGIRHELAEGDRIYVGAFTRLVLREALPGEA